METESREYDSRGLPNWDVLRSVGVAIRMSQITQTMNATRDERAQIEKLCSQIRGKLQFMDYLVKTVVTDLERHQAETDTGTRIFLRQLIEMHSASLAVESENMRVVGDLCGTLESALQAVVEHDEFASRENRDGDSFRQVT